MDRSRGRDSSHNRDRSDAWDHSDQIPDRSGPGPPLARGVARGGELRMAHTRPNHGAEALCVPMSAGGPALLRTTAAPPPTPAGGFRSRPRSLMRPLPDRSFRIANRKAGPLVGITRHRWVGARSIAPAQHLLGPGSGPSGGAPPAGAPVRRGDRATSGWPRWTRYAGSWGRGGGPWTGKGRGGATFAAAQAQATLLFPDAGWR